MTFSVHGMGLEPASPDWPPLTDTEVTDVLGTEAVVTWRSPRPFSAAALVRVGRGEVFLKRHHVTVRDADGLAAEHAFVRFLASGGVGVPAVVPVGGGAPVAERGEWVYEAHSVPSGADRYRDALSWTAYQHCGHARSAGVALARLHRVSAAYEAPTRPPAPLLASSALLMADDLLEAVATLADALPGLGSYLTVRSWRSDLTNHVLPAQRRARDCTAQLVSLWGHNDWHPSNLLWTGGEVSAVIDFGLANRTSAVFDLATAIERSCVEWLAPGATRGIRLDQVAALLDGYEAVRPHDAAERRALPLVLPVVHLDYALSEVAYFHGVLDQRTNADLAYEEFLLGHASWFATSHEARQLLAHLEAREEPASAAQ